MFKERFKYYKQKVPTPEFSSLLDFTKENSIKDKAIRKNVYSKQNTKNCFKSILKSPEVWTVYEIPTKPGLIFIRNPWTTLGQRYWIARCLSDFTKKPNKLNLDPHGDLEDKEDWWSTVLKGNERGKVLMKKLRWATLGYCHNWDTKEYSEDNKTDFPEDLAGICRYIASIVGDWDKYSAEAAIINFYHHDSTLSGHRDYSEPNMEAPLLSFSFGLSAIFLIGGEKLEDMADGMFLDNGDIVIMSGPSRHGYHGVPRILPQQLRIGMEETQEFSNLNEGNGPKTKDFSSNILNQDLLTSLRDDNYWIVYRNYINHSRINMNVRQVLCENQTSLSDAKRIKLN